MKIKMIASDMDGTFLDNRGTYDRQRFECILSELETRGIEFVVASGNQMGRLSGMFNGLTDRLTFVAENGAQIVEKNQVTVNQTMPRELAQACVAFFDGKWQAYHLIVTGTQYSYATQGMVFSPIKDFPITDEEMKGFFNRIVYLDNLKDLPEADQFLKVTMMVPIEEVESIMQDFNQNFSGDLIAVHSGYGGIDIIQTGINKAWGLRKLLEKRGLSPAQLMAFGDGGNDLEMLELAKYSYAVANAPQVVKNCATYQAPSHEVGGVLTVIEAYLKGEIHNDGGEII